MAVIREGIEATHKVDYTRAGIRRAASQGRRVARIAAAWRFRPRCARPPAGVRCGGFFDREYYDDMVAGPFREGTIAEAPVLPGTGMFMPAGTRRLQGQGPVPPRRARVQRRSVHRLHGMRAGLPGCARSRTRCTTSTNCCSRRIEQLDIAEAQREAHARPGLCARRCGARNLSPEQGARAVPRDRGRRRLTTLDIDNATLLQQFRQAGRCAGGLSGRQDAAVLRRHGEDQSPAAAGSIRVAIDPWKCTGCLECIDVCGPRCAGRRASRTRRCWRRCRRASSSSASTPNTPARFVDGATKPDGETKRLMLDRTNYYATTGGHGACRGCGEVTAIRLVMADQPRDHRQAHASEHIRELESLIERLERQAGDADGQRDDPNGATASARLIATLEKRLYLLRERPDRQRPGRRGDRQSTGCSSVYASTFPFNSYNDPWVNSLFQDAQPLAKGIFEGISAQTVGDVRALRIAQAGARRRLRSARSTTGTCAAVRLEPSSPPRNWACCRP